MMHGQKNIKIGVVGSGAVAFGHHVVESTVRTVPHKDFIG
jgi:hypothetical protein